MSLHDLPRRRAGTRTGAPAWRTPRLPAPATAPRWDERTAVAAAEVAIAIDAGHRATRPPAAAPRAARKRWERDTAKRMRYVPVSLGTKQLEVYQDRTRFRVLIAGRRFGKTHLACAELARVAINKPKAVVWYLAPTYGMAKDIAWETLKAIIPPEYVRKVNEGRLTIRLINDAVIQVKGGTNANNLRGRGLDFVVLDEFTLLAEKVWTASIRPALSDKMGSALFIGTPLGFNWGYTLFLEELRDPVDWKAWQFTTVDGGRVSRAELIAARGMLDRRLFRQEYFARFETLAGRVYYAFRRKGRSQNVDATVRDDGKGPLYVGIDFNVHPMTAVVARKVADECWVLAAIALASSSTEELARVLRDRYGKRTLIACPDPSGRARKTSAPAGQTDFTILERAGFIVHAPASAPLVKDRINNTNAMLRAAGGRRRTRVSPDAVHLITALDGLTYKEGTSEPNKKSPHIHITDAFGYLLWQEFNVLDPSTWGVSHFAL